MTYEERLRAHLAKYKFRVLRVLESGQWKGARTGALAKRPYILPPENLRLNILAPFRERFWAEFDAPAGNEARAPRLQRDFAQLTSSQAMCFNLFYPLVLDRDWARSFAQGVLGLKDAAPKTLAFEYAEDPEEGTHFDFFIELERGAKLYLETRLCELGFGSTELDERHRETLAKVHVPRLWSIRNGSSPTPSSGATSCCAASAISTSRTTCCSSSCRRPTIRCARRCRCCPRSPRVR
jgi:hypothetical protein